MMDIALISKFLKKIFDGSTRIVGVNLFQHFQKWDFPTNKICEKLGFGKLCGLILELVAVSWCLKKSK